MHNFAQRMTDCILRQGFISPDQTEWCTYTLETKLVQLLSFAVMLAAGSCIAGFPAALTINVGMAFLRKRTNGYHADSLKKCLLISLCCECTGLLLLPLIGRPLALLLLLVSAVVIFALAPANTENMHFDARELAALRQSVHKRLLVFCSVGVVLLFVQPRLAACLALTACFVAMFLILTKLGFGVQ